MTKITRKAAKIFGSTAGPTQLAEFGSLAQGAPVYSSNLDTIQSLAAWTGGWYNAIVGSDSSPIQDMNSFCYVMAYQLAYLMQEGVPEYLVTTTYYIGSIVMSAGSLFVSITDANVGNALSDSTKWLLVTSYNTAVFSFDSSWVCPSGVTSVQVTAQKDQDDQSSFMVLSVGASGTTSSGAGIILICAGSQEGDEIVTWGANPAGLLGQNLTPLTTLSSSSPVVVVTPFSSVQKLKQVISANSSFVLTAGGQIYAWGDNTAGALGVGDIIPRSSPVLISVPFAFASIAPSIGTGSTLALTPGGQAYAWGTNASGNLGTGDVLARSTPTAVLGGISFKFLYNFAGSGCVGLDYAGNAWGWGSNAVGQLGVGDLINRSSPTLVTGGHTFVKIIGSNSGGVTFGRDTAGVLWGWGGNSRGVLGVGDVNPRSVPTQILGAHNFTQLFVCYGAGSSASAFGIDQNGDTYAWGGNIFGQLGVGDVNDRSSPTLVLGGFKFKQIFTRSFTVAKQATYALDADGNCYAWGDNEYGQLGLGDVVARSSPVAVLGGIKFRTLIMGGKSSVTGAALDGRVYSWGQNLEGELGVGDTVSRSSPVLVLNSPTLKTEPDTATQIVPTVPGATYTVQLQGIYAQFGNTNLLAGGATSITLKW